MQRMYYLIVSVSRKPVKKETPPANYHVRVVHPQPFVYHINKGSSKSFFILSNNYSQKTFSLLLKQQH